MVQVVNQQLKLLLTHAHRSPQLRVHALQVGVADHSIFICVDKPEESLCVDSIFCIFDSAMDSVDELIETYNIFRFVIFVRFIAAAISCKSVFLMSFNQLHCSGQLSA